MFQTTFFLCAVSIGVAALPLDHKEILEIHKVFCFHRERSGRAAARKSSRARKIEKSVLINLIKLFCFRSFVLKFYDVDDAVLLSFVLVIPLARLESTRPIGGRTVLD